MPHPFQDVPPVSRDCEWQMHSAQLRDSLGISRDCKVWTSKPGFKGAGLSLTPRTRDVLDITAARVLTRQSKNTLGDLLDTVVDVSQSVTRGTFSKISGVCPCFTSSSELYSFGQDRAVTALEMLRLLGYSESIIIPEELTIRQLKKLVANSISLPCLGVMLWSFHVMCARQFAVPADARLSFDN